MAVASKQPFNFACYPLLFGHRGCSGIAPENTLASFQKILDYNVPGVEFDVQLCKTGEIIVLHDLNLKRTTGVNALAAETDLETIKTLDAGSWFNESFAGEKIPTLDEVFDLLGTRVYYNIEIKHRNRKAGELENKLAEKIKSRNMQNHVIISSFNPFSLMTLRKLEPLLKTALLYSCDRELPWFLRNGEGRYICKPDILNPAYQKINSLYMFVNKKILKHSIIAWTVDDEAEAEKLLNSGVDGIISNAPETMVDLFLRN